jgi:hypothetical protein
MLEVWSRSSSTRLRRNDLDPAPTTSVLSDPSNPLQWPPCGAAAETAAGAIPLLPLVFSLSRCGVSINRMLPGTADSILDSTAF